VKGLPPANLGSGSDDFHGVIRGLRPLSDSSPAAQPSVDLLPMGEWDPLAEKVAPESVHVFGTELRVGSRVRLWPQKKADIMDMALEGKAAVIEAIEQDFEDNIQLAVVVDDDLGREFGMMRQPGHRFFSLWKRLNRSKTLP
jgi:hypothetical protein